MGYIKDSGHLINYLNKLLREKDYDIDFSKLPSASEIISKIWDSGQADKFTWEFKNSPKIIQRDNIDKWLVERRLSDRESFDLLRGPSNRNYYFSDIFKEKCESLYKIAGVYSFWNNSEILYVGVSVNLCDRIPSSFSGRFHHNEVEDISLRYIKANKSDAQILETYLICLLKPPFNKSGIYKDEPTIAIELPRWSNRIKCVRRIENV